VRALLDVNVLIALLDEDHVHHAGARAWWGSESAFGWASCPLTENGVVRILPSSAYKGGPFAIADVIGGLNVFIQKTDHVFWPDSISVRDGNLFDPGKLTSGKLTDSYLIALALANGGRFVTLDAGASIQAIHGATPRHIVRVA
jgi:hypothetical protein